MAMAMPLDLDKTRLQHMSTGVRTHIRLVTDMTAVWICLIQSLRR